MFQITVWNHQYEISGFRDVLVLMSTTYVSRTVRLFSSFFPRLFRPARQLSFSTTIITQASVRLSILKHFPYIARRTFWSIFHTYSTRVEYTHSFEGLTCFLKAKTYTFYFPSIRGWLWRMERTLFGLEPKMQKYTYVYVAGVRLIGRTKRTLFGLEPHMKNNPYAYFAGVRCGLWPLIGRTERALFGLEP